MELKVSPEKPGFSSSDLASDPDEREVSEGDDEDDDRNHKHRRREGHSQSLGGDSLEQGSTRPYRKRNRPYENGYSYREGDSQSGETWRNYNFSSDRGFPSRFEKRRTNQGSFSKSPLELNQRFRGNQAFVGEVGPGRGRGREPWGIRDPRLGLVDVAPQIIQPGPMFAGRGLPNVSNAQNTPWNAFGLVPGMHNGGFDSLHPLGLQGPLGPAISPPINIGIPRQRCRDFEERGFCLRGDMCPMEHGVNRIVIEDVQSLSQFNLPISLPGSQMLGTSCGQGTLPVNSKAFHGKSTKPGMTGDGYGLNGGGVGPSMEGAADVYDPDQPLWSNDDPTTSAAFLALNQSNADERESFMDINPFDQENVESIDAHPIRNENSSVWGRIGSSKRSLGAKEKIDSVGTSSNYLEPDIKSEKGPKTDLPDLLDLPHQLQWTNGGGNGLPAKETSLKKHNDFFRDARKPPGPPRKALCTLSVNGIPLKDNKREALLSHFQKFGEVVDIYIPMHGERAFVQFAKREAAEAALRSPDAVMGNRFIKLWWASRNNIPNDVISGTSNVPIAPREMTLNPAVSHPLDLDKGKEKPHPARGKDGNALASVAQQSVYDHSKPLVTNSPKAPPVQQKKLESLELLKEQLRKKQELLDQKRNEFKRQLDKLQKQGVVSKDVAVSELITKKLKGETSSNEASNEAKAETPKSPPRDNRTVENVSSAMNAVPHASTSNPAMPVQEPLKPLSRPQAPLVTPFAVNRFKLDNRPTAFRIVSPLPAGLANVAALEEHFSTYGDLSSVELEEPETNDASVQSNISARVSFATRHFAEKAFSHGKSWQGHKLQFVWLSAAKSGKEGGGSGNLSAAADMASDANNVQSSGDNNASTRSQKPVASKTGKSDNSMTEPGEDSIEQGKDTKSTSTSSSSGKQPS